MTPLLQVIVLTCINIAIMCSGFIVRQPGDDDDIEY